jgi:hypothetical protein
VPYDPAVSTSVVESEIVRFLRDFVRAPYAQYTEHGIHAYFFSRLYAALPAESRYMNVASVGKVCRVQKEYPTPTNLGKSRRQGWDICLLDTREGEGEQTDNTLPLFDRLGAAALVEFGLNATKKHLVEDIRRLAHRDVRADLRCAVHLVRRSGGRGAARLSNRDESTTGRQASLFAKRRWLVETLLEARGEGTGPVVVYVSFPGQNDAEILRITADGEESIALA